MKAEAVFVHKRYPRAALRVAHNDFFAVQTARPHDLRIDEQITGDLSKGKAKWFFNVSRGTLINVKVLGRFPTLESAIGATAVPATG
jgi:hypothetical protein